MPRGGARIGAGRKPKARATVTFQAGLADPPAWLPAAAKPYYAYYGELLAAARTITHADRDTLATYASMLADIADLNREMSKKTFKRVIVGPAGAKTNPLVTQYQHAVGRARMLAQDLGLTPASRGRVQVTPSASADPEHEKRAAFFSRPVLVKSGTGGA